LLFHARRTNGFSAGIPPPPETPDRCSTATPATRQPPREYLKTGIRFHYEINRYTLSENPNGSTGRKGKKIDIAYELENGEMIDVPE